MKATIATTIAFFTITKPEKKATTIVVVSSPSLLQLNQNKEGDGIKLQ
jgi:hypothetical protein